MQVILDRYSPTVHTHLHFNDYWIILSIRDADATHSRSHLSTGPRPHHSTVTDPRDEAWALRYYVYSYSFIPIFMFDLQHTSRSLAATVIKRLSNFISDQDHRGTTRVVESEGYDFGHAVLYPVSAVCAYTSIGRYLDSHIKRQLQWAKPPFIPGSIHVCELE